jgi:hypothetical protein
VSDSGTGLLYPEDPCSFLMQVSTDHGQEGFS